MNTTFSRFNPSITRSIQPFRTNLFFRLGVIVVLVALFLFPQFQNQITKADPQAPPLPIAQAFPCGKDGATEGVSPGNDLFRVDVNLSVYPNGVCNDGTPAAFFVRRYQKAADQNKWIIFLLGGGGCGNGQACAERWCSINTSYGADKMSTSLLKEKSILGAGIFTPTTAVNRFGGWNQVFIYYCSSDDWSGHAGNVPLKATDANGREVQYLINFRGSDIVDAVIGMLRRDLGGQSIKYKDAKGKNRTLPDLDDAETVLFSGSSAGGNGVKHNLDRVGQMLRQTNNRCQGTGNCPLVYLGVIDANYPASFQNFDLTQGRFCQEAPFLCTYEDFTKAQWAFKFQATYQARTDESCVTWHQKNLPGTEWMCADEQHTVANHLTTPLFVRQDSQDKTFLNAFVAAGLATGTSFGTFTNAQLAALPNLDSTAEEGSVKGGGPKLRTPGIFGPQCTQHYGLSVSNPFFRVLLSAGGKPTNYHDLLWNWVNGAQPQQAIHAFTGPGAASDCTGTED